MAISSDEFPSQEYRFLETLKELLNFSPDSRFPFGIGDDAVIRQSEQSEQLIFTADTLVENIHFSFDYMSPAEIGYKAMAANVSDCAAMGAVPDSALVQVVFPITNTMKRVEEKIQLLYTGLEKACKQWDFPVVGGDLSRGACWMIAISLTGRKGGNERLLRRVGAQSGDGVWVSGMPGKSAAGLAAIKHWGREKVPLEFSPLINAHIAPGPQVETGLKLANDKSVHAAIDLSDGVAKECSTLCYENGFGIQLSWPDKYNDASIEKLSNIVGAGRYDWFLYGGEDYQLLFTASENFDPLPYSETSSDMCKIGTVTEKENTVIFMDGSGHLLPVEKKSWDHFAGLPDKK